MTHPSVGAHPTPAAAGGDALLDGLTPEQAQAVRHGPRTAAAHRRPGRRQDQDADPPDRPATRHGAAQPWEILAVTFSVRAAGELRLRLADLLGEQVARGVTAATFHSICARMLREHAGVFGRTADYTVYDQADVRRVIEWLLSDQQRGQIQQALADYGQPAAAEVLAEISLAKNRLLSPDSYEQAARHTAAPLIAAVWREAEVELQRSNSFDFDDLLVYAVRLLAEHPHRLAFYRQRWRWLRRRRVPGHQRGAERPGRPARGSRRQRLLRRRTTISSSTAGAGRSPATCSRSASGSRVTPGSCSAATSAAAPRSSTPPSRASLTTPSGSPRR